MAILDKDVESELTTALADLMELAPDGVLDIEMSWPPDDYSITFLALADGEEVYWDHEILAEPWVDLLFVDDDHDETVLEEIDLELCAMFQRCWENLGQGAFETRAFLRKHDDIEAMDLASGEIVHDRDRDRSDWTQNNADTR
jgi:hypothetical protein